MTNAQVRLLAAALALIAGGIIANARSVDVNVGLIIIILSAVIFAVEYVRSRME